MQLLSHGQSLISINFFTKTLLKERGYVVIIIIILYQILDNVLLIN